MALNNGKAKKTQSKTAKRTYARPTVTKHGSLNSRVASFRAFY